MNRRLGWSALLAVGLVAAGRPALADEEVVVVMDLSNSMWGEVEGRPKIEIAREVIGQLVTDWDGSRPLGLVAYGHRKEGDCKDIETVVPIGKVEPKSFLARMKALTPRGKTPLTDAVTQAAELLKYRQKPGTVVLVTDGLETCHADPCAAAAALEKAGVGLTVHVVGFDIKTQEQPRLRCIAENTGGRYLVAANARELSTALNSIGSRGQRIVLEAAPQATGAPYAEGLSWSVRSTDGKRVVVADERTPQPVLNLAPGRYVAEVAKRGKQARKEFEVAGAATHRLILDVKLPQVKMQAPPAEPAMGSSFQVAWSGDLTPEDYIELGRPGTTDGPIAYTHLEPGKPAVVQAPDSPGSYELRAVDHESGTPLARLPIKVKEVSSSVSGPKSAQAGSEVEVAWSGPNGPGDYIAVAAKGSADGEYLNYADATAGSPAKLRMPDSAGSYELRYTTGASRRVLARQPIAVQAAAATLSAPDSVAGGSAFELAWSGPGNEGDYLTIVPVGAAPGASGSFQDAQSGNPAHLRAPDAAGSYELRYVTGQDGKALAKRPIKVTAASATLSPPARVGSGAEFPVKWSGPNNEGDYIAVALPKSGTTEYLTYQDAASGNPALLTAPEKPGSYELRYVSGESSAILGRAPIRVE